MRIIFRAICKYLPFLCILIYTSAKAQLNTTTVTFPFTSVSQYRSGIVLPSANQLSYTPVAGLSVQLQASAAGNLISTTNPALSIPIGDIQMQVTGISGATPTTAGPVITLSTANQTLASNITVSLLSTAVFTFQYTASGGIDFLMPAGTYSTTLTYTVTNLGAVKKTFTATLSVTIGSLDVVTLQNGGNTASLAFTTISNYKNGVQLSQPTALNVFSTQPYHITVASPDLSSGANTIPISNIHFSAAPSTSNSSITTGPVSLSSSAQTIITSSIPTLSQNFDFTYSTTAANTAFLNKPAGTYTSIVTYTITSP